MIEIFKRRITRDESRDTGMAMVLLLLILFLSLRRDVFLIGAFALHVLNMIVPQAFRPVAVVWLGFAHLMGSVVSKILLSLVFFLVVTPVGVLRSLSGYDSLKLRGFKAGKESVMVERKHLFAGRDIEKPY